MNSEEIMVNELESRFLALWGNIVSSEIDCDPYGIWELLERHYTEPFRHYHTLKHLDHCFQEMVPAIELIDNAEALETAIFFHDVICNPGAPENERQSADLFEEVCGPSLDAGFVERVKTLIIATKHDRVPETGDERVICDLDLSSFALPWEGFLQNSDEIRIEHGTEAAPAESYFPAKLNYLHTMLERPSIFLTDFFRARYEEKARDNISSYISQLEKG